MKTPMTHIEWWDERKEMKPSPYHMPVFDMSSEAWHAALANAPQPTWLKREHDSDCQPPFVVFDSRSTYLHVSQGTRLRNMESKWDYYLPLPPIPKQKDEAETAFDEQHPGFSVDEYGEILQSRINYKTKWMEAFRIGRAKAKQ